MIWSRIGRIADLPTNVLPITTIVILTGAGVSQESGLDTFRDRGGVWSRVNLEDLATPQAFHLDPAQVHAFYNDRRARLQQPDIQPNPAHLALARLQRDWPGEVVLVTQNVDDLHERAGTPRVIHMHGELLKARCEQCGLILPWLGPLSVVSKCPACRDYGRLRPHVVWFGEVPLELPRIYDALARADLFVSIGTSGSVYPAAGFVGHVRSEAKVRCVELNLEPQSGSGQFDESDYGPASLILPAFVDRLLGRVPPG